MLAVEVRIVRQPELFSRAQIEIAERVQVGGDVGNVQGTTVTPPSVGTSGIRLEALEDWQDIRPAPTRISLGRPAVEIGWLPADEDHRIDCARAAENLPSRPVALAAAKSRIWLRFVHPVDAGIVE